MAPALDRLVDAFRKSWSSWHAASVDEPRSSHATALGEVFDAAMEIAHVAELARPNVARRDVAVAVLRTRQLCLRYEWSTRLKGEAKLGRGESESYPRPDVAGACAAEGFEGLSDPAWLTHHSTCCLFPVVLRNQRTGAALGGNIGAVLLRRMGGTDASVKIVRHSPTYLARHVFGCSAEPEFHKRFRGGAMGVIVRFSDAAGVTAASPAPYNDVHRGTSHALAVRLALRDLAASPLTMVDARPEPFAGYADVVASGAVKKGVWLPASAEVIRRKAAAIRDLKAWREAAKLPPVRSIFINGTGLDEPQRRQVAVSPADLALLAAQSTSTLDCGRILNDFKPRRQDNSPRAGPEHGGAESGLLRATRNVLSALGVHDAALGRLAATSCLGRGLTYDPSEDSDVALGLQDEAIRYLASGHRPQQCIDKCLALLKQVAEMGDNDEQRVANEMRDQIERGNGHDRA